MSDITLYWREPLWLGIVLLPGLLLLMARLRQKKILQHIADPHLLPWVQTHSSGQGQSRARWLFVAAWVLFSIALAGPRTPKYIPPQLQPAGITVVTIVDFSASMNAIDVQYSRLRQVQAQLQLWLTSAPPSLRMGVVIYAGNAHVLIKPSSDKILLQHFVDQLVDIRLPTLGNNLQQAAQLAADLLVDAGHSKYVVLFTDGDMGDAARKVAGTAMQSLSEKADHHLFIIGAGSSEAVSVPGRDGKQWLVDGEPVVSRRDARWLQQLALSAGGEYRAMEAIGATGLVTLLDLPQPRIDATDQHQVLWNEWFTLPLLSGLLLMLLGLSGRYNRTVPYPVVLVVLLAGGLLGSADKIIAADTESNYATLFSAGVACYRTTDYDCALREFSQAAWRAQDQQSRGRAVFNLGNTYFYLGDYVQASVLFAEAGQLGVPLELVELNLSYADSLAAAVQRRLDDIAETERRAEWRFAARGLPDELNDRLAEGRFFSRPEQSSPALRMLSSVQLNQLIDNGMGRLREAGSGQSSTVSSRQWVVSPQQRAAENTAGLFNQLLPMEIGLPVAPDEPYRLQGQRPW